MFGSTISSMNAHSTWMGVNANNVANVNSDKFKSVDTKLEEGQKNNPKAVLRESDVAQRNSGAQRGQRETVEDRSNTDLAKELTEQIPIEKGFGVNATVVKTKDEMLGTLMDIKS
jgi:flagellar hook protein FlgE